MTGSTHLKHEVDLLFCVDAILVIYISVRTGNCNYLAAKLCGLLDSTPSNVTETGNCESLANNCVAEGLKHLVYIVDSTEACSLRTDKGTAVGETLTSENALIDILESLILTEHIADLTGTCTEVTGRNVCVSTDVSEKLCHEALAESHDLTVGLAAWVKVRAALAAAHRKACKGILEGLLKTEELDDAQVNGWSKSDTALIWTDSRVKLYTVATVDMDLAIVIDPWDTEHDLSLRLYDSFNDTCCFIFWVGLDNRLKGSENFLCCLDELGLTCILLLK